MTDLEQENVETKDSLNLPGSGLIPSLDSSLPDTSLPVWHWVYDPKSESNAGSVQDRVVLGQHIKDEYECVFMDKHVGIKCEWIALGRDVYGAIPLRFGEESFVGAGQMIGHDMTLYVTHHSPVSTGARLSAYDVFTNQRKWSIRLKGIGQTDHSKYRNETYLEFDDGTNSVIVFGKESHGGYVERRDAATGKLLAHKKLAAWIVNQQESDPSIELETREGSYREGRRRPRGKRRVIFDERGDEIAWHVWIESSSPPRRLRHGRVDITSAMLKHYSSFNDCNRLSSSSRLASVLVELSIGPNGEVSSASSKTRAREEGENLVIKCVLERVQNVQFVKAQQTTNLRWPIYFHPRRNVK